jgi:flagellar assembly protein FliH
LSTDRPTARGLSDLRPAQVSRADALDDLREIRFDRPLVDQPAWADPRMGRQLAEATRIAHERGMAAGYAAGWAQGRRAAAEAAKVEAAERAEREEANRRALAARAQTLFAALAQTSRTFTEQITLPWEELIDVLLDGAMRVVASGLGRELAAVDAEVLEAARAALRLLPGPDDSVTLHVNPADVELLDAGDGIPDAVTIVPDAGVAAGTVVARNPLQSLPMDLRAALRAVEEVLQA